MIITLYNLGIRVFFLLVVISSLFKSKSKLWLNGRRGVIEGLKNNIDRNSEYAWIHASSLGEFEQGRPIIESLRKHHPEVKIILTFFSPSGYEVRKNYEGADYICYLPLDTKRAAKQFVEIVKPRWTFFVKYEYWYHFLSQAKKSGSKVFLISGIFRKNQLFFKWYGGWYRKMLGFFDHLFIQNKVSAMLLDSIGVENYTISGDSRFDRVKQIAEQSKTIDVAAKFSENAFTVVCGSTWEPDEKFLIKYLEEGPSNFKLIIAPHEIHKEHINSICEKINLPYALFSEAENTDLQSSRVLIIDNMGMLSSIYKYGKVAYIGGGFGAGIHNTIEAAVYGVPVLFGPNHQKFQEALDLIEFGGSFTFSDSDDFKAVMDSLVNDQNALKESGNAAEVYVNNMIGATQVVINYLTLS